MDRKQVCVANVKYKKPTADDRKRTKNLIKYLTYREGRNEAAIKQPGGQERWVDHGMGGSVAEIARKCEVFQSEHVQVFTLVINPHPNLVAMIPPEVREAFVRQLSEKTIDDYLTARDIDTIVEWSYCFHHRKTDDPQAPGLHNPHAHIILPGTYYDDGTGERMPLYFNQKKGQQHIDLLHEVTEKNTADLLDHYVGPDWEQRFDRLEAERERQQKTFCDLSDLANIFNPQNTWEGHPVWSGARMIDEQTSGLGVYGLFPHDPKEPTKRSQSFRCLLPGLPHEQAETFAHHLAGTLKENADLWQAELEVIKQMTLEEREILCEELQNRTPKLDGVPDTNAKEANYPPADRKFSQESDVGFDV
jgi:hypothetical protein